MGMTGIVFVRALQNKYGNSAGAPIARANGGGVSAPLGYAYNDGVALNDPISTAYDREFPMFLSEVWSGSPLERCAHPEYGLEPPIRQITICLTGASIPIRWRRVVGG